MTVELDFGLDDFEPADADSAYAQQGMWPGALTVLAEHHTAPYRSHSYVVAHDSSATWGVPGDPQVVAIKVARDRSQNTFTFESAYHATPSFAQNWLIERGCPPERIAHINAGFMKPADDLTVRIERQIRDSGQRYEVLDAQSWDDDPCETWTLTRDTGAAEAPVRVFLEEADFATHRYTMREGSFADEDAARHWLDKRTSPLPQPPENRGETATLRTRAALTRSAGASEMPKAGLDAHSAPSTGTAQRLSPGRSM
ncbi:glycosyl hydrolase [Streptomyces scopuliridis]|uniref:glycosyl hydrolase n=1 Tax=Streptomyces scopuliridis TaxID=452529 RepID=UPI0036ACCD98